MSLIKEMTIDLDSSYFYIFNKEFKVNDAKRFRVLFLLGPCNSFANVLFKPIKTLCFFFVVVVVFLSSNREQNPGPSC